MLRIARRILFKLLIGALKFVLCSVYLRNYKGIYRGIVWYASPEFLPMVEPAFRDVERIRPSSLRRLAHARCTLFFVDSPSFFQMPNKFGVVNASEGSRIDAEMVGISKAWRVFPLVPKDSNRAEQAGEIVVREVLVYLSRKAAWEAWRPESEADLDAERARLSGGYIRDLWRYSVFYLKAGRPERRIRRKNLSELN